MKKKIIVLVIVLLFLSCSCSKQTEDIEGNGNEQIDLESVEDGKENNQDNEVIIFDEDGQYLELYLEEKPWMYIANIKDIPELSEANEGGADYDHENGVISFSITKATGTMTGAVDGPWVFAEVDIIKKQVLKKKFGPAPEFDNPKYKEFSGEILEISDTRLTEIANYFYRIFNDKSFECIK